MRAMRSEIILRTVWGWRCECHGEGDVMANSVVIARGRAVFWGGGHTIQTTTVVLLHILKVISGTTCFLKARRKEFFLLFVS